MRQPFVQLVLAVILITPALAISPAEQRGRTFALTNCAECHSIDRVTSSPLKIAPPFRTLHTRYPIETLAEALAEGIVTGHPTRSTIFSPSSRRSNRPATPQRDRELYIDAAVHPITSLDSRPNASL